MKLVAIDFETADHLPDSACAIGVAVVENDRIGSVLHRLIRPPRRHFRFTYIHGIEWEHVAGEPDFGMVWDQLAPIVEDADYLLAHNASFDSRVLTACCTGSGRSVPPVPFVCTVKLARAAWSIRPTRLPDVCRHLQIPLRHHDARSDALACATIGLTALRQGHDMAMNI